MPQRRVRDRRTRRATDAAALATLARLRPQLAALRRAVSRGAANFIVRPPRDEYWDEVVEVFSIPRQLSLADARAMAHPRDGDMVAIGDNGLGDLIAIRLSAPERGGVVIVNHEHNVGTRGRVVPLARSMRAFVDSLTATTHDLGDTASNEEFTELIAALMTDGRKGMMRVVNKKLRADKRSR